MKLDVVAPDTLGPRAAAVVAEHLRAAIDARGVATLAVSGGSTPGAMLAALAGETQLDWNRVHLFQVDERVAPDGDEDRNLGLLQRTLLDAAPIPASNVHPMDVVGGDLARAARDYERQLREVAGDPPVLDVVQLGLGGDGHTASLVPGDRVLELEDRDVAVTDPYASRQRLTMTRPLLRRARARVWLVSGDGKAVAVARLLAGDQRLPASRVAQDDDLLLLDPPAASRLEDRTG